MRLLTVPEIGVVAREFDLPVAAVRAVVAVESGGHGYDEATSKIVIQFEPHWFKRRAPKEYLDYIHISQMMPDDRTPAQDEFLNNWKIVEANKVSGQASEWIAFNAAFKINPVAAMESTSIGLMQVMGFHWKALGFKSVGEMWDFAKVSEGNQLRLGLKLIRYTPKMYMSLKRLDFETFAFYYNGPKFRDFNYHTRLAKAYVQFKPQTP